jgi:FAD/FMN-containing dehydrogenase
MKKSIESRISGWGRVAVPGRELLGEDLERLTVGAVLSRGLGRAYGDSALPPPSRPEVVGTRLADRILSFDPATGLLRAEAGLSLLEINRLFLRRGWFVPVTPGTQFVTLGGMVAADVHGKNHHRDGTIGAHLASLRIRVADGRILDIGPDREEELFAATVGGMGLTGHILEVAFPLRRIPSPWIRFENRRIDDIEAFVVALKEAGPRWPFSVGWIDCLSRGTGLGRGILMCGCWAEPGEAPQAPPPQKRPLAIPFEFPEFVLGRMTVRAFNELYYRKQWRRVSHGIASPDSFFYPLDAAAEWNRMYGPRGFTQYQCVLPDEAGPGAARRFLEELSRLGGASFLCVIKDCGAEGRGILSFPRPGISIALDIPIRDGTQALVDALDARVLAEGGRIYLAKDQFTRSETFRKMEPRLPRFLEIRRKWDPEGQIRSAQSVRLLGDRP